MHLHIKHLIIYKIMQERIPQIFVLILGVLMITTVFLEFWREQQGSQVTTLDAFQLERFQQEKEVDSKPVFYIAGLSIVSACIAFLSLSNLKNRLLRNKQSTLGTRDAKDDLIDEQKLRDRIVGASGPLKIRRDPKVVLELQAKMGALNSILMAGVLGLIILFSNQGEEYIKGQQGEYLTGTYLPMAAMVCNLIANRFIRQNIRLLKSSNRMRD